MIGFWREKAIRVGINPLPQDPAGKARMAPQGAEVSAKMTWLGEGEGKMGGKIS